jgi:LysM repeat protein
MRVEEGVLVTAHEGTSPPIAHTHPAAARAVERAAGLASLAMKRPDRTVTAAVVAVLAVSIVACGTTDPASQERLPPIQTTTPTTTSTTTTVSPADFLYVVQSGDTLGKIAERFSVTIQAIMERNGLTSDAIQAGQTLEIPEGLLVVDDGRASDTTEP